MMRRGALLGVVVFFLASAGSTLAQTPDTTDQALIKQGDYIARLGDCAACHTALGGKDFAGGLPIASPLGTIYSTNITPDPKTGIGGWSYEDFARLMRTGVTKDGSTVYPAMPFPSYTRVNDPDMKALYAYFHNGVAPVEAVDRPTDIPWPLSMRWPLRFWRWIYKPDSHDDVVPASVNKTDAAKIQRGAYLVEGLGHCGACHTPRGLGMQERALDDADGTNYLSGGGPIDGWIAPSLRSDPASGLGSWSRQDIIAFLKTGRSAHSATFGAMDDVVVHSMQHASNDDLDSIAAYLKSLSAKDAGATPYRYDDKTAQALFKGDASARGAQIYVDRCAACHRSDGNGYDRTFPALAGNPVLQTGNGTSATHIVLSGGRLPATKDAPTSFVMAPYADVLSDQDIADVVSFIQTGWGNRGSTVTAQDVAAIRKTAAPVAPEDLTTAPPHTKNAKP